MEKSGAGAAANPKSQPWRSRRSIQAASQNAHQSSPPQDPITTPTLIGTCLDMCPPEERAQRERLRDLSLFERLHGNPARTSRTLAVKKFCRTLSSKDMKRSDIRPLAVLEATLTYLLSLVEGSDHPFEVVHDFLFDRMRSIRQDLSMQKIVSDQVIHMYEEMVKFHVMSHQKLVRCCNNSDISSLRYLNMEQLSKCLLSLFDLYTTKQRTKTVNANEAEFYSLYVLLCLSCKIPKTGDYISMWFRGLPFQILRSKEMQFARNLLRYTRMGNYKSFFSTVAAEASHLQSCLVEPLLNEVRVLAISYINQSGHKLHPYPLDHLAWVLMIKEEELECLCRECGLKVITDEAGHKLIPTKQNFSYPEDGFQSYSLFIREKT